MKVVVVTRLFTPLGAEVAGLMSDEFGESGVGVEVCDTIAMVADSTARRLVAPPQFADSDLVVYVTDDITIADAGGPWLRQISSWAERRAIPVIVVAPCCEVTTRELRTIGVEAGYQVTDRSQARRVVKTWVPTGANTMA